MVLTFKTPNLFFRIMVMVVNMTLMAAHLLHLDGHTLIIGQGNKTRKKEDKLNFVYFNIVPFLKFNYLVSF